MMIHITDMRCDLQAELSVLLFKSSLVGGGAHYRQHNLFSLLTNSYSAVHVQLNITSKVL